MPATASLRARPALLWVLSAVVGVLAPALAFGATESPTAIAVGLVAAAMVAVLVERGVLAAPTCTARTAHPRARRRAPAYLPARVTDVPRHPLQPRAPGLV